MRTSKLTFTIEDKEVNDLFTTYLQGKAIKWIPFHLVIWTLVLIGTLMVCEFDERLSINIASLVVSFAAFFFTKRKPSSINWFAMVLFLIPTYGAII
jgi:hypothetical protein